MAHLEGAHAGLGAVAGLQLADQAPAVVAQLHHLVERRVVAARDHAAVPDAGRRARHQRARQALDQGLVVAERLEAAHQGRRGRLQAAGGRGVEGRADRRNLAERVAHGGEVARAAAAEPQPRERAFDVRAAAQPFAERVTGALRLDQEAHAVEPLGDGVRVGERRGQARPEQARAGAGRGAVDDREQAACAAALQRRRELEIAPRCGVDRHRRAGTRGAKPREPGQRAVLGEPQIADDGAGRRELGPREAAEPVEGGDAVEPGEIAPGAHAVEERARLRREDLLPLGEELEERRCLQQRLGHQQLARLDAGERRRQGQPA